MLIHFLIFWWIWRPSIKIFSVKFVNAKFSWKGILCCIIPGLKSDYSVLIIQHRDVLCLLRGFSSALNCFKRQNNSFCKFKYVHQKLVMIFNYSPVEKTKYSQMCATFLTANILQNKAKFANSTWHFLFVGTELFWYKDVLVNLDHQKLYWT